MELCPCYWRCDCKEGAERIKALARIKAVEELFNGVTERDEHGHHKVPYPPKSSAVHDVQALRELEAEMRSFGHTRWADWLLTSLPSQTDIETK